MQSPPIAQGVTRPYFQVAREALVTVWAAMRQFHEGAVFLLHYFAYLPATTIKPAYPAVQRIATVVGGELMANAIQFERGSFQTIGIATDDGAGIVLVGEAFFQRFRAANNIGQLAVAVRASEGEPTPAEIGENGGVT